MPSMERACLGHRGASLLPCSRSILVSSALGSPRLHGFRVEQRQCRQRAPLQGRHRRVHSSSWRPACRNTWATAVAASDSEDTVSHVVPEVLCSLAHIKGVALRCKFGAGRFTGAAGEGGALVRTGRSLQFRMQLREQQSRCRQTAGGSAAGEPSTAAVRPMPPPAMVQAGLPPEEHLCVCHLLLSMQLMALAWCIPWHAGAHWVDDPLLPLARPTAPGWRL